MRPLTDENRRHIFQAATLAPGDESVLRTAYDACVVGSGPGGSVAAVTLAQAGLKVLLIERGPFHAPENVSFRVLDMSNRSGCLQFSSGHRVALYQGNVLGGGSILYGAVAMKPPPFIFEEWNRMSGVRLDASSLEPHYAAVGEVMSATEQTPQLENRANAVVRRMAAALGKADGLELVHRYTPGCAGVGLCTLGCGFNLKGTMLNSFLPIGLDTGRLSVLTDCEVVSLEGGDPAGHYSARGVNVVVREFGTGRVVRRHTIKAGLVVVSAGAFFSSAILLRTPSLAARAAIGRKVYLQPHAQVFAVLDQPVTSPGVLQDGAYLPYNGVPAIYNFSGFLKDHRFFWLASSLLPANLAGFTSHLSAKEHFELMRRYHYTMSITITLRDDPARSRVVLHDGRAGLEVRESQLDVENLRRCLLLAAEGFLAVGARQVFLPMNCPPEIKRLADLEKIRNLRFTYEDLLLYSDHTSGGNPYGVDPEHGATDADGRVFGTENVYVADSSLFPSACGVNPSWTIMALSRRVALAIAARHGAT